jgi:hypothetical protein
MNFNRSGHRDNLLFVILLLLPAIFAGARYFESERQMNQIAQVQAKHESVAGTNPVQASVRIADAHGNGRR